MQSIELPPGMDGAWAEEYSRWIEFCREAVLSTVDARVSAVGQHALLGYEPSTSLADFLAGTWGRTFRSYLTRSGKMFRPVLVCFTARALNLDPRSMPQIVAMAEIIHSSSLVLDDVADASELRRGAPTAHRMVGVRSAGLLGSAWLNACFDILLDKDSGVSQAAAHRLGREMAWEHWVTGLGTTIDTVWPSAPTTTHPPLQYLQSVVHRSTSYTYRMPFKIGACAAEASDAVLGALSALGEEIGLAFQILDDQLNVAPSTDEWGKATGEDITAGKVTLQVLLTMERASTADATRLEEILRAHTTDRAVLEEAVNIMRSCGALDAARDMAGYHLGRCKELVESMDFLEAEAREVLNSFVSYLGRRDR